MRTAIFGFALLAFSFAFGAPASSAQEVPLDVNAAQWAHMLETLPPVPPMPDFNPDDLDFVNDLHKNEATVVLKKQEGF